MGPMYYIGLDVHKQKIGYCVKDVLGKIRAEGWIPATRFDLDRWMKTLPQPWSAAMEATMFSGWIYDHLKPHAAEFKVAHPLMLRAIAAAKKKNGLERVFVLGLVGWLQVELLLHFRELEALNRWDHIRRPFSLAGAHARPTEANKRKRAQPPREVPRRRPQTARTAQAGSLPCDPASAKRLTVGRKRLRRRDQHALVSGDELPPQFCAEGHLFKCRAHRNLQPPLC